MDMTMGKRHEDNKALLWKYEKCKLSPQFYTQWLQKHQLMYQLQKQTAQCVVMQ